MDLKNKKLSKELEHCLGFDCGKCAYWAENTTATCKGLLQDSYEKIKIYEDLEEQCVKENSFGLQMLLRKWKEFTDDIQELYEYRELEKQGKLLKLPCTVGDMVYRINNGAKEPVIPMKVCVIGVLSLKENGFEVQIECRDEIDGGETYYLDQDMGKAVFLTKEEAEAALQKMNGEST